MITWNLYKLEGFSCKKNLSILVLIVITAGITACGAKEDANIGVNTEILEMNTELKGFVVKALDEDSILGEKCYISCEGNDVYYSYADYDTGETEDISYHDFLVGDEITVDIKSVENNYSLASRVQLSTQRK